VVAGPKENSALFTFALVDGAFQIQLSTGASKTLPTAHVQVPSGLLAYKSIALIERETLIQINLRPKQRADRGHRGDGREVARRTCVDWWIGRTDCRPRRKRKQPGRSRGFRVVFLHLMQHEKDVRERARWHHPDRGIRMRTMTLQPMRA
jgi:hypothetical protein